MGQASSWDLIEKDLKSPWYVGAGGGYGNVSGEDDENWSSTWYGYAGYRFDRVWGIEFGLTQPGELDMDLIEGQSIAIDGNWSTSASLLGFAYYRDFSAFYRVGVQYDDYDTVAFLEREKGECQALGEAFVCQDSAHQISWLLGLGGEFPISDAVFIRTEWISAWGQDDFDHHQALMSLAVAF
nr:outer membrane beta-barrel protein [Echinimonas agarilytica]